MMWEFMKSKWFVPEVDNWHIKDDAPEDVKKEFAEYMKQEEEAKKKNVIIN